MEHINEDYIWAVQVTEPDSKAKKFVRFFGTKQEAANFIQGRWISHDGWEFMREYWEEGDYEDHDWFGNKFEYYL